MKNKFLVIITCVVFMSCSDDEKRKISHKENESLINFLINNSVEPTEVDHVLIIPAEQACESCAFKAAEFINALNIPDDTKVIISSYSKESVNLFMNRHNVDVEDNIILDFDNFFSTEGLIMIHPVLYDLSNKIINKQELYPVNVESTLLNLFGKNQENTTFLEDFYELSLNGKFISNDQNQNKYLFESIDDGETVEIELSKPGSIILNEMIEIENIILKKSNSFKIGVFVKDSETGGIMTSKRLTCKSRD